MRGGRQHIYQPARVRPAPRPEVGADLAEELETPVATQVGKSLGSRTFGGYGALMNLDARAFSQRWVQNWNNHDLEAVLRDFHDDVVFTSPVAAKLVPQTHGVVRGKAALRQYWTTAVERIPDLRFVVESVYQGIDTIVITYRNQNNAMVNEVLRFKDNAVIEGHGTYRIAGEG